MGKDQPTLLDVTGYNNPGLSGKDVEVSKGLKVIPAKKMEVEKKLQVFFSPKTLFLRVTHRETSPLPRVKERPPLQFDRPLWRK